MSRICGLRKVRAQFGNNVSHSERKTRRKFSPNLQTVTLISDALSQSFKMRIAVSTLRSIEIYGGLDNYLIATRDVNLTALGAKLRGKIKTRLEAVAG